MVRPNTPSFTNVSIIVTNYSHSFNKIFSPLFFFVSAQFHNHFFLNLTKIMRHYFYKTYKIFEKFDGVLWTFSISSLKFLLKLASHYEKLQNMS